MIDKIDGSSDLGSTMSAQPLNDTLKQKSQSQGVSEKSGDDFKQKAQSMGVPDSVIQQGMQAVKAWVMENKNTDSSESLFNITV